MGKEEEESRAMNQPSLPETKENPGPPVRHSRESRAHLDEWITLGG